jgi:pimeloyl-ACP methyl ester carboxylesterase
MAKLRVEGAELYYEQTGDGDPLVLVHGSWGDHNNWMAVVPELAKSFRVIAYDRRGNSQSTGGGTTTDDVADLASVVEELAGGTAHVAGNSFGALVTLKCACSRPELFRSLSAHEPPLFGLLATDPATKGLRDAFVEQMNDVVGILESGDMEGGCKEFIERIAFGPGAWATLPEPVRTTFVSNAATWLDEVKDPGWDVIDLDALGRFERPVLLSQGDQSPPQFAPTVDKLRRALPGAEHHVFAGAGHVPHVTHPADYAAKVRDFASHGSVEAPTKRRTR